MQARLGIGQEKKRVASFKICHDSDNGAVSCDSNTGAAMYNSGGSGAQVLSGEMQ